MFHMMHCKVDYTVLYNIVYSDVSVSASSTEPSHDLGDETAKHVTPQSTEPGFGKQVHDFISNFIFCRNSA